MEQVQNNQKNKGCLKAFTWILLTFSVIMFVAGISILNDKNTQKIALQNNKQATTELVAELDTNGDISLLIIFGIVIIIGIFLLIKLYGSGTNNAKTNAALQNQIEKLKALVQCEPNEIKKKILNNQIGVLMQTEAEQRLKSIIKKYEDLLQKTPKPELEQMLQQHRNELLTIQEKAESLRYDVIAELSDEEKELYSDFCESFKTLRNSNKIWIITEEEKNNDYKSFAQTTVKRKKTTFYHGYFNELQLSYEIPVLSVSNGKTCYFYPRFVIVASSSDFAVLNNSDVSLLYSIHRFQEDGPVPSDAKIVGQTYKYVNKNGEPDKRYSYNPSYPIALYGGISVEPFGTTFMVSNNAACNKFYEAYLSMKVNNVVSKTDKALNFSTTRLNTQTPEQYFGDIWYLCKRIYEFATKLTNDEAFIKVMTDNIKGDITINGNIMTDPKDKIHLYMLTDILNCYNGLEHPIELDKKEGLALLLYAILYTSKGDINVEYSRLNIIRAKCKNSVEDFLNSLNNSLKEQNVPFCISLCLKEYDAQLHDKYIVLMYRYASLIAKADGTISETEINWLNKIMDMKIGEDSKRRRQQSQKTTPKSSAKELESLIGLTSVKAEVTSLANYIKIQKMRQEKGLKTPPVSYHCVFTGNPGTGKTTVARIVAQIYQELGILKKGHLVETDRSGLVAEYVGQTAVKTNKIIDSALDGVLFIDEAYSLVDGGQSDYGKEAISTLLKRMEDDRNRLVVILAGYTNDMKRFIDSNPGLQSRFNRYIEFPDYTADELLQIFEFNLKNNEYCISDEARSALTGYLQKCVDEKDERFGNGRFVRNLFEKTIERQANRLSQAPNLTAEMLTTIEVEDLPE
ncbi:MAG: AAA family ATPase [Salinivirgaceae bacterium]|nr:AAA family ATPase [Salinivirgaceae bacterium]